MDRREVLSSIPKAVNLYMIHSEFTRLPYIECDDKTFDDVAFFFDIKENADKKSQELLEKKQKNVIMVSGEYHEGVLGIVASNIVEKYQKPVFIMNEKEGILKGSARSIFDFNIYVAMNKISDLFLAFGGHTLAAGFSFEKSNFEKIEEFLDNEFEEFKQNKKYEQKCI